MATWNWAEIGAVAGLPALGVAIIGLLIQHRNSHRKELTTEVRAPLGRSDLLERYAPTRSQRYYRWLDGILAWSENFYGPRWSRRTFVTCLSLAYIYPLFAALLAWAIAGQTMVGTLEVFQDIDGLWARLSSVCFYLVTIGAAALILLAGPHFSKPAGLWAQRGVVSLTGRAGLHSKATYLLIEFVTPGIALIFAIALSLLATLAVTVAVAVSVTGVFGVAVAFAVMGTHSAAVLVGVIVSSALVFYGEPSDASLFLFFYFLLPLANALADWVSVSLTRWFLQDTFNHRYGAWMLMLAMLLDFFAGLAALALLLAGLVGLLEIWSLFGVPPLDWRAYWTNALTDRSQGVALWVMCFTTLLPTLVHAAWALVLWLSDRPEAIKMATQEMAHWDDTATDADQAALALRVARQIQRGQTAQILRVGVVFAMLTALALWFEIWTLTSIFPTAPAQPVP